MKTQRGNRGRLRLKCDGTRAETRFRLSAKRTSPFKSAGESVQSTTGSRVMRISDSNAGYTKFRRSVKGTGYPLHSSLSPSFPLPCVTMCHHVSTGLYSSTPSLTSALDWGEWSKPRPDRFNPGKLPDTDYAGDSVGPRAALDESGKFLPHRDSFPGPFSR